VDHRHVRTGGVDQAVDAAELGRDPIHDASALFFVAQVELVAARSHIVSGHHLIDRGRLAAIGQRDVVTPREEGLGDDRAEAAAGAEDYDRSR
jgi:hypothetical protein